jgi:glycosyltransferase involved in cell wall biosynthesis
MERGSLAVLIPAYRPTTAILTLARRLSDSGFGHIVVVDDGSGDEHRHIFSELAALPGVTLLRHAVNLGKGAALKTGMNYIAAYEPGTSGIITADADGQHDPEDVVRVGQALLGSPGSVVLGARRFDAGVPFRSRFGNAITRAVFRVLIGHAISDTQTGLRAIPMSLVPHLLRTASNGYEFELDMLLAASRMQYRFVETPIRTIYLDGNATSHFDPLFDSMRIYFVLLRFGASSAMTAALDNLVFILTLSTVGGVLPAQFLGRVAGATLQYLLTRNIVFLSHAEHKRALTKYLALVVFSGTISYALIRLLTASLGINVVQAKLIAETVLFIANFAIMRDFVFRDEKVPTE